MHTVSFFEDFNNALTSNMRFSCFIVFYKVCLMFSLILQMEQGLAELRKIFIKKIDEVIEKAKNTNEIEASLPSVRACLVYY